MLPQRKRQLSGVLPLRELVRTMRLQFNNLGSVRCKQFTRLDRRHRRRQCTQCRAVEAAVYFSLRQFNEPAVSTLPDSSDTSSPRRNRYLSVNT